MDPSYFVALALAVCSVLSGLIGWMARSPVTRAAVTQAETDALRAGTEQTESTNRQLSVLIKELRTSRDWDRKEIIAQREAIDRLDKRVETLVAEARVQTRYISELRGQLHGAGVAPQEKPAQP